MRVQQSNGIPVGWAVISGNPQFFALTKSVHHLLHGSGTPDHLDADQADQYRAVLEPQAAWLADQLDPGDVVALHDPQTLGMAPILSKHGIRVVWHCHIGSAPHAGSPHAAVWQFFEPYFEFINTMLVSRAEFAPPQSSDIHVVLPAIDPDSPKNRRLPEAEIGSMLASIGLIGDSTIDAVASVEQEMPLPASAPMVLQVSRWDPLKGMIDVLRCLERFSSGTHLVLAGPEPSEIPDDPEGAAVLAQVRRTWSALPGEVRSRAHLVTMSMREPDRNALLVNALQRRADVVTQKSLQEGFGLTVTEAMFKGRAVVASDIGGIRAQIEHGRTGLLADPADHVGFADEVSRVLRDPALRHRLGEAAAASVTERFLIERLAADYQQYVHPDLAFKELA